jgi:hypothetical protein
MATNENAAQQNSRCDLDKVRKLAASMSDEDGVFSTDIKTLKQCRDSLLELANEVEQLRAERAA